MKPWKPQPAELAPAVFLPPEQRAAYWRAGAELHARGFSLSYCIAAGLTAARHGSAPAQAIEDTPVLGSLLNVLGIDQAAHLLG